MKKVDNLENRVQTMVESMGFEFVGMEFFGNGRRGNLRIYIDNPPRGITINDCEVVSKQIGAMLDVEDPIPGSYQLEVSSPGLDRILFKPEHYKKYIGSQIKVILKEPVNGRRVYKGLLQAVGGTEITILVEGLYQTMRLLFSMIEKANVVSGKEMPQK